MLARYPLYDGSLDDPKSEEAYELVLSVVRAIRSILAEYAIKEEGVLYVQTFDETSHATCTRELSSIRSLSGKSAATVSILSSKEPTPMGCVPIAVSASATVFLLVKGRVDIDQEIEKARKKLERASETVKKQKGILSDEGYRSKVSEELQEVERKKLKDAEAEVREMETSMQQFERLKLE